MNLDHFEQAARTAFRFLEEDYEFEFASEQFDHRARRLTYTSDVAFVSVDAESLGFSFTVALGAIRDGVRVHRANLQRDDLPLECVPLWALLRAKDVAEPPSSAANDAELDTALRASAAALRDEASAYLIEPDFAQLAASIRQLMRDNLARRNADGDAFVTEIVRRSREPNES
jgi:hypothetical protein